MQLAIVRLHDSTVHGYRPCTASGAPATVAAAVGNRDARAYIPVTSILYAAAVPWLPVGGGGGATKGGAGRGELPVALMRCGAAASHAVALGPSRGRAGRGCICGGGGGCRRRRRRRRC